MKVYSEVNANDFRFWSGAADTVEELTAEELTTVWEMLEELYPDGIDKTEINDFFWFERDTIFDEIMERRVIK